MKSLENISYKNTFLNQVIIRLDFRDVISEEKITNKTLVEEIQKHFTHKEISQIARFAEVKIDIDNANAPTQQIVEGIQMSFLDSENNKAVLASKFLIFEINFYRSFKEHMRYIEPIIKELFKVDGIKIERTGIRYINIFDDAVRKIRKSFYNKEIAASVKDKLPTGICDIHFVRSLNTVEYQVGGMKLLFRYGMFNPNYPQILKRRCFALDYDCFNEQLLETYENIMCSIQTGHEAIQTLFEESITDTLRKVLNE